MFKLYQFTDTEKNYWEAWENDDKSYTVHRGSLGENGNSKSVKNTSFMKAKNKVFEESKFMLEQGYSEIEDHEHKTLIIEYKVTDFGTPKDTDKRYKLEARLNEVLGWSGLGHCDGGSIGSGTMEVCCFVVDYDISKLTLEKDLEKTEFSDYTRIYEED